MLRSDIWSRTATGGMRAMVAGRRVTSAFMSLRSSSSCFRTARGRDICSGGGEEGHPRGKAPEGTAMLDASPTLRYLCAAPRWLVYSRPLTPWTGAGGSQPGIPPLRNVCSEPWMDETGLPTCSGRQLAAAAPRSPALAPGAARQGSNEKRPFSSHLKTSLCAASGSPDPVLCCLRRSDSAAEPAFTSFCLCRVKPEEPRTIQGSIKLGKVHK